VGFRIAEEGGGVTVTLTGLDSLLVWKRRVRFERFHILRVRLLRRGDLERTIVHRELGIGTHHGANRPGRRRVGVMIGRGVVGRQFWAVGRGGDDSVLVVLDLRGHLFARAVLDVAGARELRRAG
jgi:hypothetical protein